MKKYKTLSLLLAFCVVGCVLWYGGIAGLEKGSRPTLETVSGDVTALKGMNIEGFSSDWCFSYQFAVQDGKLNAKPYPVKTLESQPRPGQKEVSWNITQTDSGVKLNALCYLRHETPRGQYDMPWDALAQFDTGLDLSQQDWERIRREPTNAGPGTAQSAVAHELIPTGAMYEEDGVFYAAVNLPWGGSRIYKVTNPAENMAIQDFQDQLNQPDCKNGQAECVIAYDADEVSLVDAIYPIGDAIMVLTQTDAGEPCWCRDENGTLQALESPVDSQLTVHIYDSDFQLKQTLPLLDLPEDMLCNVSTYLSEQKTEENTLCLKLNIYDRVDPSTDANWSGAVTLQQDEDGTVRVIDTILYPKYEEAFSHDMPVTDEKLSKIEMVQTNPEGTRTAIVRNIYPEGEEWRLEVYENGERVYWGRLHNGSEEDQKENQRPYRNFYFSSDFF